MSADDDIKVKVKIYGSEEAKKELDKTHKEIQSFSKNAMSQLSLGKLAAGNAIGTLFAEGIKQGLSVLGNIINTAFSTAAGFLQDSFDKYIKFEDQLYSVKKTVGFTKEEMKSFGDELLVVSRSTRTATEELANIARVGGQLDMDKKQIVGFTKAIDTLNVALGDEFVGGAEEITTIVGRMAVQLKDIGGKDTTDNILRIGNALNVLGTEGSATGGDIADMVTRMTASSKLVKVPTKNLLGFATVLQETGINTERAGTAMSELFKRVPKQANEIAQALSEINPAFDGEKFKKMVDTDFVGALEMMSEAVANGDLTATDLATTLDEMGFSGGYVTDVLLALGQNMDLVREKSDLAGIALGNTDSITQEFADRNESTAAKMDMLNKRFDEAKMYFIEPFVNGLVQIMAQLQPLIDAQLPKLKTYIETVLTPAVQRFVTQFIQKWPQIRGIIENQIIPAARKFVDFVVANGPRVVKVGSDIWRIFSMVANVVNQAVSAMGRVENAKGSALGHLTAFQNSVGGLRGKLGFANGGIVGKAANGMMVGGNSFSGDKLLARVNSGEMILNKQQQAALFQMLQQASGNTTNNNFNAPISFGGQRSDMQQMNVFNQLLTNI